MRRIKKAPPPSGPNLRILRPSRKVLRAGDIFRLSPQHGRHLFGRVISTEALIGSMKNVILIYIYKAERTDDSIPDDTELTPGTLLIEPVMINRLPWSRGYFETVDHRALRDQDRLPIHCFSDLRGCYFDDANNRLARPIGPVGVHGLHSFRTVDDLVCDALGIPRAPD